MPQYRNESAATENLQRYLRQLSYHNPAIFAPPIDGVFGSDTARSLRDFQGAYGLPVTGSADRRTWDVLYAAYRASRTEHTQPRSVAILPFLTTPVLITQGSHSFAVTVLQHMLRELSALYTELEEVEITGGYDDITYNAVKLFQKKNRLPESGITDVSTWNAVTDQYNMLFASEPYL
ncbi:MAG: hypothetical protein E7643_04320 [Ruminococcaceae bacterium]|nr:hypothetical protein [Oscillospiraceae bacterium]